ncbi:hypothetical protein EOPP23_02805 [Endozoicomonas sp. OPT23]|uniref:hypothetical protein n=1 Tax=Endozoicomonas sp. OPT23 TaxID=2072845 RepID=UPI00129B2EF4|nr:hypothetical protein [Endozoicomonas sp. OPT23]MRI31927.1 hypothetical protein [Endozoicomonas sp. OPT23]
MNHTQFAINSIGKNINSLMKISSFIGRSKNYHYVIACVSCSVGSALLASGIVLGANVNLVASLGGAIIAYAFTIYSAFGARACENQLSQIQVLEKEMEVGRRELQILASKVSRNSMSKKPAAVGSAA